MIVELPGIAGTGIVQDLPDSSPLGSGWSDAAGVHFNGLSIRPCYYDFKIMTNPAVAPFWIMPFQDPTAVSSVFFYMSATAIYKTDGTTNTNVSRAVGGAYNGASYPIWTGGILGGIPFVNHNNMSDAPQQWDSAAVKFKDLVNWPAGWYCKTLRTYEHHLLAMDMVQAAVRYPTRICWSNAAEPGTVPSTWTPAASNEAGDSPLSATVAAIQDSLELGNINIIYKEDSCFAMQYVGGNKIFDITRLFGSVGLIAPRAVKEFEGQHFVVSFGDVHIHNGTSYKSIGDKRVKKAINNAISSTNYNRCFVAPDYNNKRMYVCFPSVNTGTTDACDVAYVWDWGADTWSKRYLRDIAHIAWGVIPSTGAVPFDSQSGFFDDDLGTFDEKKYNPSKQELIMGRITSGNLRFYQMEQEGSTYFDTDWFVERKIFGIPSLNSRGDTVINLSTVKFVSDLFIDVEHTREFRIDISVFMDPIVGGMDYPTGPAKTVTRTFTPPAGGTTFGSYKVGVLASGRYMSIKISGNGGITSINRLALDVEVIGQK